MTSGERDRPSHGGHTPADMPVAILLAAVTLAVYAAGVWYGTATGVLPARETHFSYLADAFLAGRLDVQPQHNPWLRELVPHGDKWYVVYPPMPAIVLLPWVAIFGPDVHTSWVSAGLAACAVGMTFLLLRRTGHAAAVSLWATIVFAFGTAFWYSSLKGSSWHFAHVVAVVFLLMALLEGFGKRRPLLTGLLLGMAGVARLPVFMAAPVFAYLVAREQPDWIRRLGRFALGVGVLICLNGGYNWARYGTVVDVGYYRIPGVLQDYWYPWGIFDLRYVPRSLYAMFLQGPVLVDTFPYLVPSVVGLGIFFVTPAFFMIFQAPASRLTVVAASASCLVAIPALLHGGIGATQFGYRFSLDFTPFLVLLMAQGFRGAVSGRSKLLVVASVLVSLWGLAFVSPVQPGWLGPRGLGLENRPRVSATLPRPAVAVLVHEPRARGRG